MKQFLKRFLAVAVVTLIFISSLAFADGAISVTIDGEQIAFTDQEPIIIGNRTLVPIRDIFEAIGFTPEWNENTRQATLTRDGDVIIITIDSSTFATNGVIHTLDVPAQIIGERTLLPLRAVLESIGYELDWDNYTRTVAITSPSAKELTHAQRFVAEQVALNSILRDDGNPQHSYIILPENNTVIFASFDDVVNLFEDGTGVLFFGRPACPWCRLLYPVLLQVAIDEGVTLLYYNIEQDRAAHNQNYVTILERLHNYLPTDEVNQSQTDEDFDPEIKRVVLPHIFVVRNGEVVAESLMFSHPLLQAGDTAGLAAYLRNMFYYRHPQLVCIEDC